MSANLNGSGKLFRQSWADMNSDDSSMGAKIPSLAKRKGETGYNAVQLPKSTKTDPASFSLVCDDSYAPTAGGARAEAENRGDVLNDALRSVNISKRSSGAGDFSLFGILLPKSDDTLEGDNTRSRIYAASSEESKLGKRLLSAVSGGQSDFSAMMGQEPESSQPCKFRRIDEEVPPQAITAYSSTEPLVPSRKTMNDGSDRNKQLNSKRLQIGILQPSTSSMPVEGAGESEWEARFQQRVKQIELGKATKGYLNYIRAIPKERRSQTDPQTPDSREMCSKRQFDGKLHKWRKGLHNYDPDSNMS